MNLAFPAAFLLAVLFPGLIFLRTYHRGWRRKPETGLAERPSSDSLQAEIARSPILALLLHVVWCCLSPLVGYPVDLKASLALVLGSFGKDDCFFDASLNSVVNYPLWVSGYFLSIWVGAACLGYLSDSIVWANRLDLKWPPLRYDSWFYLFRGELDQAQLTTFKGKNIVGVRVSAVVPCGNETFIYRGIFHNYMACRGTLDEIWLRHGERRRFADDKPGDKQGEKYYRIEGDLLVLKASEIRTINLEYIDQESVEKAWGAVRKRKSADATHDPTQGD